MGVIGIVAGLVVATLLVPLAATAHDRSVSYSRWRIDGNGARIEVRLWERDITRFPWAMGADRNTRLARYATDRVQALDATGEPCPVTSTPRRRAAQPGHLRLEWEVDCGGQPPAAIRSRIMLDVVPSHLHFARVDRPGAPPVEALLSEEQPELGIVTDSGRDELAGAGVGGYLRLGIEHILSGWDHLVFLFALFLVGRSLLEVAKVITGFTVAHSITLALAVLGVLEPDRVAIESLIGLSIALVAVENVWLDDIRDRLLPAFVALSLAVLSAAAFFGIGAVHGLTLAGLALFSFCYYGLLRERGGALSVRWAIAFLFGLIHGFGFAGVLLEVQLPAERLGRALFGFNAGVELGQLAVAAAVWPILQRLTRARAGRWRAPLVEYGSAAVLAVGVFWFVSRAYG